MTIDSHASGTVEQGQVVLYAEFTATSTRIDDAERLILDYARTVRAEPGNLQFDVYRRNDDPAHFVVFERYRDRAAFDAHLTAAAGQAFNAALAGSIQNDGSELTFLTPVSTDDE